MSALSDHLENAILDHVLRARSYTAPATVYIGLLSSPANDAGGGTEVSGGGYARVAVVAGDTSWNNTQGDTSGASTGADGTVENAVTITFPQPSGANWGAVNSFGIYDAPTGGNLLIHSPLSSAATINDGDAAPSFAAGALTVQIDD